MRHPYWAADLSIVVRTSAEPGPIIQAMGKKARQFAPETPVKFTTAEATLNENIAIPKFRTVLLGIFGAVALLAIAGIYSVISYMANQRLGEIGLRIALGASPADVARLVLREELILASLGINLCRLVRRHWTLVTGRILCACTPLGKSRSAHRATAGVIGPAGQICGSC